GLAFGAPALRLLQKTLRRAQAAGGDVQPLLAEPGPGDVVRAAALAEHLALRDGAVLEDHLGMLVLRARHELRDPIDAHARSVPIDDEQRLLAGAGDRLDDDRNG